MEKIRSYIASTVGEVHLEQRNSVEEKASLPVLLDSDIPEAAKYHQQLKIKQFKTRVHVNIFKHLANYRNGWKKLDELNL